MAVAVAILAVVSLFVLLTAIAAVGTLVVAVLYYVTGALHSAESLHWGVAEAVFQYVTTQSVESVLVAGTVLSPVVCLWPAWLELRALRARLTRGSPAAESHPYVDRQVGRLAQLAGVPKPDVVVREGTTGESYALGGRTDGTIVVSESIIWTLNADEMDAVLAHELSHLINGDSRIMTAAVVPMLVAEDLTRDGGIGSYLKTVRGLPSVVFTLAQPLALCCQLGASLLSRGREFAADQGAVALTGDPAALATALDKLDDARDTPSTDLRQSSVGSLNILPPERSLVSRGPFRSHPPTTARIERLRSRVADLET